jgi:hypothetical protein
MARNEIMLRGSAREQNELITNAAARPGSLMQQTATGYRLHQSAGGAAIVAVLKEQHENQGNDIDDNVAANDQGTILFPELGAVVNFVTADTIARGEWVESAGNGTVRLWGSGYRIGQAVAASDLSGSVGRVEVVICPIGV